MSRYYDLKLTIWLDKKDIDLRPKIFEYAKELWCGLDTPDFYELENDEGQIETEVGGEGSLSGGESEEEFVERFTHGLWHRVRKFVRVNLRMTYLEDLPYEDYEFTVDDYNKWKAKKRGEKDADQVS